MGRLEVTFPLVRIMEGTRVDRAPSVAAVVVFDHLVKTIFLECTTPSATSL